MRVFMISFDRALVGEGGTDAVERHRRYADKTDKLNIVVVTSPGAYQHLALGDHLEVYPTNAKTPWGHARAIWGYFFSIRKHEGINLLVAQDLAAPVAFPLARIARIPLIASVHGVWWDAWFARRRWWHRIYLPALTWTLRHADAVRAVSQSLKKLLIAKGVAEDRITVIPTPVVLARFLHADEEKAREIQVKYEYPIVLSVGRLENEKGCEALLAAWKKVVSSGLKARLLIVGEGSERKKLEGIIAKDFKDNSVALLGALAPTDVPPYYRAAAVCASPRLRREATNSPMAFFLDGGEQARLMLGDQGIDDLVEAAPFQPTDVPPYYRAAAVCALASESESFGKVLVEAGASGIPCVATATKGASEIIQDGRTGYLVPVGDTGEMAEKIVALLKDAARAKEMGEHARARCAALYDGERVTEQIIALWRRIARRTKQ